MKTWIPPERFLPYLTWKQVDALPRDRTLLVLPTAAIEQHGHHLPLATDTLINNLLLGHALQKLPKDLPVFALAPVHYGKSNEHVGYPGTLSLHRDTFIAVLRDLGRSIKAAGFQKLVFFNSHGGNHSLIDVMARDLRDELGLRTFCLYGGGPAEESILRRRPMASTPAKWKPLCCWPEPQSWSTPTSTRRTTSPASVMRDS